MPEETKQTIINEQFFNDLYRKYYVKLCRFAYYYLNSKELAEEIVQDLFLAFWDKREKITIDSNLESYLYISVRNAAFSKSRRINGKDNNWEDDIKDTEDSAHQFNEELFSRKLKIAVSNLPERCRLVYCLKYIEGLTHTEIAQYLNIREKTIETQLYRALLKLRKELAPFRMEFYNTERP